MPGVYKEFWTDIILEDFYPDGSFLKELQDFDALNDNNIIHLSEVGAEPNVLENNTTYPIASAERTDNGIDVPLSTFDTENTIVRRIDELETNYDKTKSVLAQHKNVLAEKAAVSAAYNLTPLQDTVGTPVIKTTGADRGDEKKKLKFDDVLRLSMRFNKGNFPKNERVLVLCPEHEADLLSEDSDRYNAVMTTGKLATFKVYTFSDNALYDPATGKKQPKGALTGNESSFAFVKSRTLRCMGDIEGEPEKHWAKERGYLIGLQMRFIALPLQSKGFGAIYSDNV
ncbi:hypothetical protein JGH11_02745 [Dysgonomonas sp. Marseille-P4677]|uniref:hypothetical protein n=1 Tax=Dysgonomonas sp. Marseille-P4677 TaxID=2364790 RepID=UPI0019117B82|nr:hypothetical protein [Dysgonomonas sp. Marseille-P4677]MBK5719786.1 hypothetical protein [Dysgonomonas sp. Marseille-P4677]